MGKKNFYDILGVSKKASQDEIRNAYRKIAKEKHPDRFSDGEEKEKAEDEFKSISEAYSTLSDPKKRAEYDNPRPAMNFNPFSRGSGSRSGFRFNFVSNPPLEINIEISVDEAFSGTQKMIHYERLNMCGKCAGTGNGNDSFMSRCDSCNGAGRINIFGPHGMLCRQCNGVGQVGRRGCAECGCSGCRREKTKVKVNIPAGCMNRGVISLHGAGNFTAGMPNKSFGDLYVRIVIADDDTYKVDFPDLTVEVPVSYSTALLGGSVIAPSPHGGVRVTIPPRTHHGTKLRVSGKGLKASANSTVYGNLIVSIFIDMPIVKEGGEELVKSLDGDLFEHERIRAYEEKMNKNSSSD